MQSVPFCSKLSPLSKIWGRFLLILLVRGDTSAASDVDVVARIHVAGT